MIVITSSTAFRQLRKQDGKMIEESQNAILTDSYWKTFIQYVMVLYWCQWI